MKIPREVDARWALYEEIAQKCRSTEGERSRNYENWRQFYLYGFGGDSEFPCKFNKIYPHIDTLTSFLYSQETTRFSTSLGVSVSDMEMLKVGPINRGINDEWNNSNSDIVFGNALLWSLVYSSTFIKPRWKVNGIEPFVVEPHNFGVLREDSPMLSTQEAFTHRYMITQSQLADELRNAEHPRREAIMNEVIAGPNVTQPKSSMIDRIVTSASSPLVVGNVDLNLTMSTAYRAKVREPLVEMTELYIYDSELADFRVITLADPYVLVYDRPLEIMFLKNEPPFVQVCPIPTHDYFWGMSEVERLIGLQEMLNERWDELRHMMKKQARPPKSFSGFPGITDEIALAFDMPDGQVSTDIPGAKVEEMSPSIPEDLFKDLSYIENMFEDTSGINNVMSGKGESGVRSSGHASQLARLGSSRVKKRAMIIEDSLEKLATMYLKIKQRYDTRRYKEDGDAKDHPVQFTAHQFTSDFVVKVDGHSNSPIFVEDQTQIAFELIKVGAITKERLLELVTVPMRDMLLSDLKSKIEPAEQAKAKQEHEEKMAGVHQGRKHA